MQVGEYLPVWRDLEETDLIVDNNDCSDAPIGGILKDSVRCTFGLYNGSDASVNQSSALSTIDVSCF